VNVSINYYDKSLFSDPSPETKETNFKYVFDSANFRIDAVKLDDAKEFAASTLEEIEVFRIKYMGKKGLVNDLFSEFNRVCLWRITA
jgi:hypothetical protein